MRCEIWKWTNITKSRAYLDAIVLETNRNERMKVKQSTTLSFHQRQRCKVPGEKSVSNQERAQSFRMQFPKPFLVHHWCTINLWCTNGAPTVQQPFSTLQKKFTSPTFFQMTGVSLVYHTKMLHKCNIFCTPLTHQWYTNGASNNLVHQWCNKYFC